MRRTSAAEVSVQAVSPESILAVSWAMAHGAIRAMAVADSATPQRLAPDGRFLLAMNFPPFFAKKREQPWCHGPARRVNRKCPRPEFPVPAFRAAPVFCAARIAIRFRRASGRGCRDAGRR